MESKILNNKADQKPLTRNPLTSASHNNIIKALITNRNNPKVTMVTGNVKIMRIGLINKLSNIKTAATIRAVKNPETVMPGKIFASTTTAIALSISSTMVFIDFDCCFCIL